MLILRNLVTYLTIIISTFIASSLSFLCGIIFGPFHLNTDRVIQNWSKLLLLVPGIKVDLRGIENLNKIETGAVLVANHQSNVDIPIIFASFPKTIRFMAKKSLFKIPVFGHALRAVGMIPIDREKGKNAIKEMEKSHGYIDLGVFFTVFPEGTRSLDHNIKEFKKGGFVFAINNSAPVLPVTISGAYEAMPKQSWLIRPFKVIVEILPPIKTESLELRDRNALLEKTRYTMVEHHMKNLKELGYE